MTDPQAHARSSSQVDVIVVGAGLAGLTYMDGAIESGQRAAHEVLARLHAAR